MQALNPLASETLRNPNDKDDPQSEFDISLGITGEVRIMLLDEQQTIADAIDDKGDVKKSMLAKFFRHVCERGLKGLRHYKGRDGKPVQMQFVADPTGLSANIVAKPVLDEIEACVIPGSGFDSVLNWLGSEIWNRNTLSAEQKKRFDERLASVLSGGKTVTPTTTMTTPTAPTVEAESNSASANK